MNNQAEMQDTDGDDGFNTMFGEGDSVTETEEASNFFEGTYRKSVALVFTLLQDLIERFVWAGHPIETHPPTYESEIASLLAGLTTLSPLVGDKLQIDTSNINKHPCIQKVLNNHTHGRVPTCGSTSRCPWSTSLFRANALLVLGGCSLPWQCS